MMAVKRQGWGRSPDLSLVSMRGTPGGLCSTWHKGEHSNGDARGAGVLLLRHLQSCPAPARTVSPAEFRSLQAGCGQSWAHQQGGPVGSTSGAGQAQEVQVYMAAVRDSNQGFSSCIFTPRKECGRLSMSLWPRQQHACHLTPGLCQLSCPSTKVLDIDEYQDVLSKNRTSQWSDAPLRWATTGEGVAC